MSAMNTPLRIIAAAAATVVLTAAANAAQTRRPSVGLLPFQSAEGGRPVLAFATPGLISWELFYIPGLDQTQMQRMERARQIDRIRRPASVDDEQGWSRLAARLGVDYLVTGTTQPAGKNSMRLDVFVYPADARNRVRRFTHETRIQDLPTAALHAARDVAAAMGIESGNEAADARERAGDDALEAVDEALRLYMAPDGDISDIHSAARILEDDALDDPGVGTFARALHSIPWSRGDRASARELLRTAQDNLMVLSEGAIRRLQAGVSTRGRWVVARWVATDPGSYLARIAEACTRLPEDDRGKKSVYARARALVPKKQTWRMMLTTAEVLAAAGDLDGAAAIIEKVKADLPRSAYVRVVAGQVYMSRGRHPAGRAEYEAAANINPESYTVQAALAAAYFQEGDMEKALRVAERIRDRWPEKSEGHRLAARIYLRNGDQARALEALETVRRLDPDGDIDSDELAAQYVRSGRILDGVRELARGHPDVRRFLIVSSLVLTGVFLLAAVLVAVAVRAALAGDRGASPRRDDAGAESGQPPRQQEEL